MVFTVTVDRDEDGVWVVECPSIPGCVSQGKTKEEALENIKDAIRLCLEVRAERGLRVLHTSPEYDSGNTWAKIIAFCAQQARWRTGQPAEGGNGHTAGVYS